MPRTHTTTALRLLFGPHVTKQPGKRSALVTNYNKMGPKQQQPQSGCCMFVLGTSCLEEGKILKFSNGDPYGDSHRKNLIPIPMGMGISMGIPIPTTILLS